MAGFSATLDAKGIQETVHALGFLNLKEIQQAKNRAAKRAMVTIKAQMAREVAKTLNLKIAFIKSIIKIENPLYNDDVAKIISRGKKLNLIYFNPAQGNIGVSAFVHKGKPPMLVKGAFIARMQNGKARVMLREYEGPKMAMDKKRNYAKMSKKYRLPIFTVSAGTNVPHELENIGVMAPILVNAGNVYQDRIEYEIGRLLEQMK
jgi:hypothetical protein